jgi:hypothetical protein
VRDVANRRELIFDAVFHQLVVQGSFLEVVTAPSAPPYCITRMIKMRPHFRAFTRTPDVEPLCSNFAVRASDGCFIDPFDRPGDAVLSQRRGLLIVQ